MFNNANSFRARAESEFVNRNPNSRIEKKLFPNSDGLKQHNPKLCTVQIIGVV